MDPYYSRQAPQIDAPNPIEQAVMRELAAKLGPPPRADGPDALGSRFVDSLAQAGRPDVAPPQPTYQRSVPTLESDVVYQSLRMDQERLMHQAPPLPTSPRPIEPEETFEAPRPRTGRTREVWAPDLQDEEFEEEPPEQLVEESVDAESTPDPEPVDQHYSASPLVDAGPVDAGPVDAGPVDAGPVDAGPVDAGPVDAGPVVQDVTVAEVVQAAPAGRDAELVSGVLVVPGVDGVHLESDEADGPRTVRLVLTPEADVAAVSGAVDRLLRERFGWSVEAERRYEMHTGSMTAVPLQDGEASTVREVDLRVSPVFPARHSAPEGREPVTAAVTRGRHGSRSAQAHDERGTPRLALGRVQYVTERLAVTASVTLQWRSAQHTGVAEGSATPRSAHRCLAAATTRSLESAVGAQVRLEVESAEVVHSGPESVAVVHVSMLTERGAEYLTGSSVVRDDPRDAVVRATLAATNRQLADFLLAHDEELEESAAELGWHDSGWTEIS